MIPAPSSFRAFALLLSLLLAYAEGYTSAAPPCGAGGGIFHDMHDGDMKRITIWGSTLTITPFGNKQNWTVQSALRPDCTANIDFHVPGKPAFPPVNLTAAFRTLRDFTGRTKVGVEFYDPSGTLASPTTPLNLWLEPNANAKEAGSNTLGACEQFLASTVLHDMHDGDQKKISYETSGGKKYMHIVPHNNNQTWVVDAPFDVDSCSAMINFDVPGKPGPPPVALRAFIWRMPDTSGTSRQTIEFTDPSSTIAPSDTPLNGWVYATDSQNVVSEELKHLAQSRRLTCPSYEELATPYAAHLTLSRYQGFWYEVYSHNVALVSSCHCTRYNFTMQTPTTFTDDFTCRKKSSDAKEFVIHNKGGCDDKEPGKMYESLGPANPPYWVIGLFDANGEVLALSNSLLTDSPYEYALVYACVGSPLLGEYTYFFSRSPTIPDATYQKMRHFATERNISLSSVVKVPMEGCSW